MSGLIPAENLSPRTRAVIETFARSGESETIGVAEILNGIAENGPDSADNAFLAGCAEQIRDAAQSFIDQVAPPGMEGGSRAKLLQRMQEGPGHWLKGFLIDALACVPSENPLWGRVQNVLEEHEQLQPYVQAAQEHHAREGEIEVDDNALVSLGEDNGAYVQSWLWVEGRICGKCNQPNPDHWTCEKCGHISCEDCLNVEKLEEVRCHKCAGLMECSEN